ncbi:Protein sidekick-1 [Bienertia sinuspersici]
MNRWEIQQNTLVGCEEFRGPSTVSYSDRKGPIVVCPKPRRIGFLASNLTMSLRWQRSSHQTDVCDSRAELLDMILTKEGHGEGRSSAKEIASSPPFFCGSPPSRVSNPIVQDAQFGEENLSPLSTLQLASPSTSASPSPSPSSMKSGGVRMKFGLKSPTVRVEGFDCLSRDHQNSGITAMA